VRNETSPEDVGGMHAARGILTARGGMTSHAAVVARGWGKCCVSGCSEIRVNEPNKVSYPASCSDIILGKCLCKQGSIATSQVVTGFNST
jgi:phosphoenolpyruvate synthase/pyruvate phosphate dikinase